MRHADFPMRSIVYSHFWKPSRFPNLLQVYLLERSTYLLSRTSGIFEFCLHFPLQNWVLPTLLLVCQNRGSKVIFWVFLTFFGGSKSVKIYWPLVCMHISPIQIQKCWFFIIWRPPLKASARWRGALGRKLCVLAQKFQKCKKCPQIFKNLGWLFSIKCCDGPRKPQPRCEVYLAFFASSISSSTWPSSS